MKRLRGLHPHTPQTFFSLSCQSSGIKVVTSQWFIVRHSLDTVWVNVSFLILVSSYAHTLPIPEQIPPRSPRALHVAVPLLSEVGDCG